MIIGTISEEIFQSFKVNIHLIKSFFVSSWIKVLYDFVMNDNVGPWARVTRPTKVGRVTVPSQQEYEKQLKSAVNQAHKQE